MRITWMGTLLYQWRQCKTTSIASIGKLRTFYSNCWNLQLLKLSLSLKTKRSQRKESLERKLFKHMRLEEGFPNLLQVKHRLNPPKLKDIYTSNFWFSNLFSGRLATFNSVSILMRTFCKITKSNSLNRFSLILFRSCTRFLSPSRSQVILYRISKKQFTMDPFVITMPNSLFKGFTWS